MIKPRMISTNNINKSIGTKEKKLETNAIPKTIRMIAKTTQGINLNSEKRGDTVGGGAIF